MFENSRYWFFVRLFNMIPAGVVQGCGIVFSDSSILQLEIILLPRYIPHFLDRGTEITMFFL